MKHCRPEVYAELRFLVRAAYRDSAKLAGRPSSKPIRVINHTLDGFRSYSLPSWAMLPFLVSWPQRWPSVGLPTRRRALPATARTTCFATNAAGLRAPPLGYHALQPPRATLPRPKNGPNTASKTWRTPHIPAAPCAKPHSHTTHNPPSRGAGTPASQVNPP